MNSRWLDLAIIVFYLCAVAWIGLRLRKRQTSTDAYFVARRSVPHWAMAFSFFATLISSITFIAYPGSAYAGDWRELVPGFMVLIVLAIVGAVVIPFFRQAVRMSTYEYFGKRFGYGVRAYTALGFSLGHFSKMGFVVFLQGLTINTIIPECNRIQVIIIVGLVTILYTLLGGIEGVIWTEVLQGIVMWTGTFVCLGYLLLCMPGGPGAALRLAWDQGKFALGPMDLDLYGKGFWVMAMYGFFWYLQKYTGDQTIVQRYLVAKSDKDALKGVALGALMCLPAWAFFMLIGTLLWAYYHLSGEPLPPHVKKPDDVFPSFVVSHIPAGAAGLFMAALLAAGMSTLASDLNCLSAVFVQDYYSKLRTAAGERERLAVGKAAVAVFGLAAIAVAIVIALTGERTLSLYFNVSSVLTGGIAGIFILAFLSPRANRVGIWAGIIACVLFVGWGTLTGGKEPILNLGRYNCRIPAITVGVLGHLIVLVVGWVTSLFTGGKPDATLYDLTLWGWLRKRREHRPNPTETNIV